MNTLSTTAPAAGAVPPTDRAEPHPATAHPIDGAPAPTATAPAPTVDKTNWKWCHGCHSPQPPEGRVGFRCAKCAAKAKAAPKTYEEPKPKLYDNAGNLIKKVANRRRK